MVAESFEEFKKNKEKVTEASSLSSKPDLEKIEQWGQNPVKGGSSSGDYAKVPPKDWDNDQFKHYIEDNLDPKGKLAFSDLAEMFGFDPNVDIVNALSEGSGLNSDKNFKKLGTWGSALYDIWEHIQKQLGWK